MEAVYTPDDRGMIFREVPSIGRGRLGFLDLQSKHETQEPRDAGLDEQSLALSEDGRWLAFVS